MNNKERLARHEVSEITEKRSLLRGLGNFRGRRIAEAIRIVGRIGGRRRWVQPHHNAMNASELNRVRFNVPVTAVIAEQRTFAQWLEYITDRRSAGSIPRRSEWAGRVARSSVASFAAKWHECNTIRQLKERMNMGRKEAWRRLVIAGLVVGMATTVAPGMASAKAGVCAGSQELAALETRVLQTELMVGALTCGQSQQYNMFVTEYKSDLVRYGKTIRTFFQRAYGGGGKRQLNTFVTKLANDSSQRSNAARQGYCVLAAQLFDEATATPKRTIIELVDKPWIRSKHEFRPCN